MHGDAGRWSGAGAIGRSLVVGTSAAEYLNGLETVQKAQDGLGGWIAKVWTGRSDSRR